MNDVGCDDNEAEHYEVGYRRPPKDGQFQKGRSGNPSGRPKKTRDFGSQLIRELDLKVVVNEMGKRRSMKKSDALVKQLVNKALDGDFRATRLTITEHQLAVAKALTHGELGKQKTRLRAEDLTDDELLEILLASKSN